jgi:hypothetical protein
VIASDGVVGAAGLQGQRLFIRLCLFLRAATSFVFCVWARAGSAIRFEELKQIAISKACSGFIDFLSVPQGPMSKRKMSDKELISLNAKVAKSFAKVAEETLFAILCEFLRALSVKVDLWNVTS